MKLRSSILGAFTLSLSQLLTACSDEAPPEQVGAISPPDASSGEGVTPAPHQQPFGGVIGNTVTESVPAWQDMPRAPEGAPNGPAPMRELHAPQW